MTDDERIELVAQALWLGQFGTVVLEPRYQAWAADQSNKQTLDGYRAKARELTAAAKGQKHHSLGWLP